MSEFFSCYTFRKDVSTRAFEYASFFFLVISSRRVEISGSTKEKVKKNRPRV